MTQHARFNEKRFRPKRLKRVTSHLEQYIAEGKLPSASCLVLARGEEAYYHCCGYADVERKVPMRRDHVVRIYSMTKPITSVALLQLYEKGLFQLDDPVVKYISEWADMPVYECGEGTNIQTAPITEAMTIKHLLTHTSGLTYGFMRDHPVDRMYRERQVDREHGRTLRTMIESLADIPLRFQPGSRWSYSVATDVCGYLVELLSGQRFDDYITEHVTTPLGMVDTGFSVNPDSANRLAACYSHTPTGMRLQDDPTTSRYLNTPTFFSGGGGLVSTIDDYARFAGFLLDPSSTSETILSPKTIEYLSQNHLPGGVDLAAMGQRVFSETSFEGVGFGLGVSVVVDPAASSVLDSVGAYGWGGAASTYFWVDPVEHYTAIFITQLLPSSTWPIRRELKTLVNQALDVS